MGKAIFTQPPALMRSAANNLSDRFSTERTYAVGEYVIHNNQLYKCVAAVETAGEWNERCWEATTIGTALESLLSTLFTVEGSTLTINI